MVQLDLNKIVCLTVLVIISLLGHSQNPVTLQFTGQDQYGQHVPLSTVTVENVTKHWQEVLYYPDTTLIMGTTGIEDGGWIGDGVRLFQNTPNPFDGVTDFALHLPEASTVTLEIHDLNGKEAATYQGSLDPGSHLFRAWLVSPQTYLLQARTSDGNVQIKMVNTGNGGQSRMEYLGKDDSHWAGKSGGDDKGSTDMPFSFGDWMMYVGDVHLAGTDFTSDPVLQMQNGSELITLPFNLPLPTVTTEAATNITPTEAKLNGLVVETSGYPVFSRGFLITDNAQLVGASDYTDGAGGGSFHYEVSGLQMGTRYYYRAYARTALGTTFGDILYFDTQSDLPEVHTLMVTDTGIHWANCGGNVTFDGGSAVTVRGLCWSTTQNPTVNDTHTTNGTGIGSFASHIAGLHSDTTYYVRAYATNSVGTAYGEERSFTTLPPFYCGIDSVADYDGNVYPTIEIGQQCWMRENLRTTHYPDGTEIPIGGNFFNDGLFHNLAYIYSPNDNSALVPEYGYLYNWVAATHGAAASNANPSGVQGVCPDGWHVPSRAELVQLISFVNSQSHFWYDDDISGKVTKALVSKNGWELSTGGFAGYDPSTNNATGFSLKPAGSDVGYGYGAHVVSTSQYIYSNGNVGAYFLSNGCEADPNLNDSHSLHTYPRSVRCVLDDPEVDSSVAVAPVVNTLKVDSVMSSTAACIGFVTATGGAVLTARGVCWSTTPHPTVSDSHTNDGTCTGRIQSSMGNLIPDTTYYVRAYATNSVGTAYGEELSFTTYAPTACGGYTVTDYDGNVYHTIPFGTQCWLQENMRATHYADGTAIPAGSSTSDTTPCRLSPNGYDSNVPTFGYLYNWAAALHGNTASNSNPSGVQGVCPDGWHVPSQSEWEQLVTYVSCRPQYVCNGDSGNTAKALASSKNWQRVQVECTIGYDPETNNASKFSAMSAGYANNGYHAFSQYAFLWSTTFQQTYGGTTYAKTCMLYKGSSQSDIVSHDLGFFSVRCISDSSTMEMDSSTMVIPSVTTDTLSAISISSATCGGFVIESGSSPVSARGVCWSTSHNPTVDDSHTITGSGTGSFKSKIDSLYANTTYYVRAYATNSVGTAYGEERSFTTLPPFYCGIDSVTDYDGNVYTTVEIGEQCWMKENLRTTHYADGTEILVGDPNSTYPTFPTTPYRCSPGNNNANVPVYGLLYNGYAACGSALTNFFQGVCPEGWHLPNQNEYEQLTSYVGNQSQYVCGGSSIAKSLASPSGWIGTSSNTCSVKYCPDENNATGFTAVPAGANGNSLGDSCLLWTRSLIILPGIYLKSIVVVDQTVCLNSFQPNKRFLSVRCLHNGSWIDSADLVVPCVTTDTSSTILSTSATCAGFVSGSGGSSVTARGVCWSTSHNPTVNDSHTSEGSGTGRFSSNISGLATGTTYYVRAYATNSVGTAYGEERSFTTLDSSAIIIPSVTTDTLRDIFFSSATCGGFVVESGWTPVTARGVCWSTSHNPTVNDSHTTNGSGTGSFTSHIDSLYANTTYYVRAYATNSVGTAYGEERSFTTLPPFYCGIDSVADYDGNVYPTVEIGSQCWMKENLRATHYMDGTAISVGLWEESDSIAYRYYPNNNSENVPAYGYMYNWAATMHGESGSNANPSGVQGICPPGWHVPSKSEFEQLMLFVSSQSQYLCNDNNIARALSASFGWFCWDGDVFPCFPACYPWLNNATGFSALPAGHWAGSPSDFGRACTFWSSTSNVIDGNFCAFPFGIGGGVGINGSHNTVYAHPVRCLLDDSWLTEDNAVIPSLTTKAVSDVAASSANCGGQIYGSGGAAITARGICWDTLPNPTVNNNHTSDGNGTGGYTSNMTNLMPNTTYFVRAYATNSVGTAYGEERSFTTTPSDTVLGPFYCGIDSVTDYDGNVYPTVEIGQQCWMRETLRTTHYTDGTEIPVGTTISENTAYRYYANNSSSNVSTYGYLYNWAAVMHGAASSNANPSGVQGICPLGWHVPSKAEFEQLLIFVGNQIQYVCGGEFSNYIGKALAIDTGWIDSQNYCAVGTNQETNNATGFSALPSGAFDGIAYGVGYLACFYSSTEAITVGYPCAHVFHLGSQSPEANIYLYPQRYGYSVRCLRD